ncbi:hypothetical protein THASP1DRAFT_28766 [Thamnocephalis sphaerospora]|uniref:DUF1446-domain-containing protein n=1 Tax=Thamnocephalis sphaerospora TaxID=78915 RepID=A0A4P9XTF2_9FUNG|nr:hypothetical protein THASP1DRAFT_28766 [Thamnocephalis sphaerospora]|eukprot:RKP09454.1 hypothetical protein THASP1DRAFT_28766 [Thamnocephalis sphaerospora]
MTSDKVVRIGCYSAFWGDSATAAAQLVNQLQPPLDYMVADYLAEVTMGILARKRESVAKQHTATGKAPGGGYVSEFVTLVVQRLLPQCMAHGTRIITNAGGLDPLACKQAIEHTARELGISPPPRVAAVYGDDLMPRYAEIAGALRPFAHVHGATSADMDAAPTAAGDGGPRVTSLNAYTGAWPIVQALRDGADIVVTGRAADSALVLGPLAYEFGWQPTGDWDRLASGSLAGHIIECGCQATGGNFTDWELSARSAHGGWANMGYPVIECRADGSFVVTKPEKTGGIVSIGTVGEQMLYETLDPGAYMLPDVVADFRMVTLRQVGQNRVEVRGARGRAPSPWLKVSGVHVDGYKMAGELVIGGIQAREKALAVGNAVLQRSRDIMKTLGLEDFCQTNVEVLGAEHTYGQVTAPHALVHATREVVLRITVLHTSPQALRVFGMELAPAATCMAPGITGNASGRPHPQPQLTHFAGLIARELVPCYVSLGDGPTHKVPFHTATSTEAAIPPPLPADSHDAPVATDAATVTVPLIRLCYGRSGDKGDTVNIGILARDPAFYPILRQALCVESVQAYMAHLCHGSIHRYELPGSAALNFVLTRSLGGGGLSSLNVDRQGKTYAQMLLSMPISVPRALLASL